MAVASISVILTVVVLKLHHCSPHQKKIPDWLRKYILGYLARFVRCSCVTLPCKISKTRVRSERKVIEDSDVHEIHARLLKEMETLSRTGPRTGLERDQRRRNCKDVLSSKINLDVREHGYSNRSSVMEDDFNGNFSHDGAVTTMEDILKYLKVLVVKSDAEDIEADVVDEWKQVALVIDRLFFWMFMLITVVSSVIILVIVPSFKYIDDEVY
ncbi:hypothetical protein DPMN_106369 [Dreissena polymorpha]|uniref:Neurotransmitter-gated ion-channel transmembrane domain-containing protein n=2 Tax=Dreissena polymorpha TaxID=45954 RepID=A0A9D4QIE9_DREPO|nr:hypothetical protein DPMN_106369 [Dreissena polymorpha]